MSKELDQTLKKAFVELQEKMVETNIKLKRADTQIETIKQQKHRFDLTMKEIALLPADTKTYRAVGRMFIFDEMNKVKKDLISRSITAEEFIKGLEHQKTYLQCNFKESENNLRELVQQRKNQDVPS